MVELISRLDRLFVCSFSKTDIGTYVRNGWIRELRFDASHEEIAGAVLEGLVESGKDIAEPPRDQLESKAFLRAVGANSWREYVVGTKVVVIERADGPPAAILAIPTRNMGSREGFVEIEELQAEIRSSAREEEVGAVLRRLLEDASAGP